MEKENLTQIWGSELEKDDYIKVPRLLLQLGKYDQEKIGKKILPRHVLLILTLASRKYKRKPLRAYWEELARDIGAKPGTIRNWAYEMEKLDLLKINRHKGPSRNPEKPGVKKEATSSWPVVTRHRSSSFLITRS
jgi:hypothetical protein